MGRLRRGFKDNTSDNDTAGDSKDYATKHPHRLIDQLISGYRQGALRLNEGDQKNADYFLDCSVAEYYTRLKEMGKYADWKKKEMDNMKKK